MRPRRYNDVPTIEFGQGRLADIDLTDPTTHAERDLRQVWRYVRNTQPVVPFSAWRLLGRLQVPRCAEDLRMSRSVRRSSGRRGRRSRSRSSTQV
jgi:hypothetical protein